MRPYILVRLLQTIPVLIGISFIVFALLYFSPGDPAVINLRAIMNTEQPPPEAVDAMRLEMNLDKPWYIQYGSWLTRVASGDLGYSYQSRRSTYEEICRSFPVTFLLSTITMIISCIIAIPLGILSGVHQNSLIDHLSRTLSIIGLSIPDFFIGILGIMLFSIHLNWFPVAGYNGVKYLILPAMALAVGMCAISMRLMRTSIAEVLEEDYIKTAVAKGLSKTLVIKRHAIKNAIIPVITYMGTQYGWLFGGAVIIESLFALPGLGRLFVESASTRDIMVLQGCVLVFALVFLFINLGIDILHYILDPRVGQGNE
ncbi:MAG TPA: ABC transporter permease [Methanospirillum sp.]|jgi:peptide/nickel transport system permease protein|uniref:ABC transporter permease n=1 Tax=Methanospirillum sp. TaxID=45200 RepID=UPI001693B03F|nr:ABC transporter permease [Methanospirillum sp.]NLE27053.1 ABC transporter permease [Clostridiaceae bacterium]NLL10807.1 ABC transporter permease [Methanomicrobiales archaeon]HPY60225.1 ABC transporter permease [Methanospirillum sp.]HQC00257.1 ABC transporter permease [Methanospirillum sp.]